MSFVTLWWTKHNHRETERAEAHRESLLKLKTGRTRRLARAAATAFPGHRHHPAAKPPIAIEREAWSYEGRERLPTGGVGLPCEQF